MAHNENSEGNGAPGGPPVAQPRTQQCNAAMRSGLVGYWNFAPAGATTVPAGAPIGALHTLSLGRTNRATGAGISVAAGWTVEPLPLVGARPTFNGFGTVGSFSGMSLAADGEGVTIAARVWLKGGNIQGGAGPLAKAVHIFGLAGQYGSGFEAGMSVYVPDASLCLTVPSTASFAVRQWTGSSAFTLDLAGSRAWPDPMLVIMTLERSGSIVTGQLYVNGDAAGPQVGLAPALIDLSRVTFGDAVESDGSVTEAALWNRKLSFAEIVGQAYDLTCVYGEQPEVPPEEPEEWPLLNDDGTSSVAPEWPVPLEHAHGSIASEGVHRETRLTHERSPRRYTLRIRLGNGKESLILKELYRTTRGGAKWTRWRHPKDDPVGPPETAPRYRWVNAADGATTLKRKGGGSIADFTLILEDV